MSLLITICVRGGSRGIPKKNIKNINGKPLIYYSLKTATEYAKELKDVDIVLSTDSEEIKSMVENMNFPINTEYIRPSYLASDTAGKVDAIYDVKKYFENKRKIKYDVVLDLDVTSPLRTVEDLKEAYALLQENKEAYNIFSVSPANRNPYFNMVEAKENGFYYLIKEGDFLTRQSTPKVYDLNASFYFYKDSFFIDQQKKAITSKSLVYEMNHICFDLDHPIDFEFMSFLLTNNKLNIDI